MKKIILILLLIISVILPVLSSCSKKDSQDNNNETTAGDSDGITPETEFTTEYAPDLPAVDMNGKSFRIFNTGWCDYAPLAITDLTADEITGDPLNDAVFNRRELLEDKYNIKIQEINGDYASGARTTIMRSVQADDGAYDLCLIRIADYSTLITNKCAIDLSSVPTIDVDRPWWDSNSYESFSLLGKHYGICSDITMNDDGSVWCMYFNKKMIRDNDFESPYNLVTAGKWIYDKVFEMAKAASKDLNGDGRMDGEDRYGILHSNDTVMGMLNCMGVNIGELDHDENLIFTFDREVNIDKMVNVFTQLFNRNSVYNVHARGDGPSLENEQLLFNFSSVFDSLGSMRAMEQDFGILPYPKYDEKQEKYMSSVSPLFTTVAIIPSTNSNLEDTGIILEEMAYQGYKNMRPAFYENLLQRKIARDEESEAMLDYLFDNVVYDVGAIWNISNFTLDFTINLPPNYDINIASFIEARKGRIDSDIEKIMESMQ